MNNRLLMIKVFLWRLVSIPISAIATYVYTGEMRSSIELTVILTIVLTTCQFVYEKMWRAFLVDRLKKVLKKL